MISRKIKVVFSFAYFLFGCVSNTETKQIRNWLRVYGYEETPIQANAGYYMTMVWRLSLEKKVDTIYGILQVDGQQTGIKYQVKAKGDSRSVAVTFYDALEGPNEGYKLGDTLFVLTENDSRVITEWKRMTPRLEENYPTICNCFNAE